MRQPKLLAEVELAALAKRIREASGKSQAEGARDLRVSRAAMAQAENNPEKSFFSLRKRIIEKYSQFKVVGPVYWLEQK